MVILFCVRVYSEYIVCQSVCSIDCQSAVSIVTQLSAESIIVLTVMNTPSYTNFSLIYLYVAMTQSEQTFTVSRTRLKPAICWSRRDSIRYMGSLTQLSSYRSRTQPSYFVPKSATTIGCWCGELQFYTVLHSLLSGFCVATDRYRLVTRRINILKWMVS